MALILNGTTGISGVDGSAATPAFKGNDSNTGVSFGTDTVTINTGGVARVTTDASGNVGVGTVSPSSVSGYTALNIKSTLGSELQLGNTAGTAQATLWCDANGITYTNYAATSHIWVTAASEKMRIDASGNVGIGTSSPATALYVYRTATDSVGTFQGLQTASGGTGKSAIQLDVNGKGGFAIANDATSGTRALTFSNNSGYGVSTVEAMRLTSDGTLLVGTTATSNTNGVKILKGGAAGGGIIELMKTGSGNTNGILNYYQTTYVGGVNFDNTSTSFPTSSDIRLKKDIVDAPSATQKIDNIRIVSHGWKHDDAVVEFGVIAQELVSVAPNAVMQGDDGDEVVTTWSVDYSKLVPLLIKAHQEQQSLITQLQADVAALKGAA